MSQVASRSRRLSHQQLGRLGATVQILFAVILGGLSTIASQPTPEPVPRGLALVLVYGVPGLIGYLGLQRGSAALLAAAAVVNLPGSLLSWTFVTLIFLVPAILMGAAAIGLERADSRRVSGRGVLVSVLLAALMVGAGLALIFMTEPLCWIATETPTGLAYQVVPTIEGVPFGAGESGGCTSAATTIPGAILTLVLEAAALAIAWRWASRARPTATPAT